MSNADKLARAIAGSEVRTPGLASVYAAARVRKAFVVIDQERVQWQVDTVVEYEGDSPWLTARGLAGVPRIKSGAAHVAVRAGADHARAMAVHYLALAQWIDEHPPVDEKAVKELTDAMGVLAASKEDWNRPLLARDLARRLVAAGWKREVTS